VTEFEIAEGECSEQLASHITYIMLASDGRG
jgi:hypothetical protein